MDQLLTVCRAIRKRDEHIRDLRKAEEASQKLSWYRFVRRSLFNREMTSLHTQIEACEKKISPDDVLSVANMAGSRLWHEAAGTVIPDKNPYGRAGEQHFEEILGLALEKRDDLDLWIGGRTFRLATLSDVFGTLSKSFIDSNVRAIIAERAEIAASTDFLHKRFTDSEDNQVVLVQHVASGLRARFVITEPGFGSVYSKPYAIQSIDPDNPGESLDWQNYVGLGIGMKLYQEGHRLMPDVRWMSSAYSAYSQQLRKKLHASDPYIWNGSCPWCDEKFRTLSISCWQDTDQEFFIDHP
jgi:hypothetical protein